MAVYVIPGQSDISLVVGGVGDKTTTVVLKAGTTHVRLKNLDSVQGVMYAFEYPPPVPPNPQRPVFPADWSKLDPKREVEFPAATFTSIHFRKLKFIRGMSAESDVPIEVQLGETVQAV